MRDPSVGVWVSEDGGVERADTNKYRYARNNPINWTDPSGQEAVPTVNPFDVSGSGDVVPVPIQGETKIQAQMLQNPVPAPLPPPAPFNYHFDALRLTPPKPTWYPKMYQRVLVPSGGRWAEAPSYVAVAVNKAPTKIGPFEQTFINGNQVTTKTLIDEGIEYREITNPYVAPHLQRQYFLWSDQAEAWYRVNLPILKQAPPDESYSRVTAWTPTQKILEALKRIPDHLLGEAKKQALEFLTPENLALMSGALSLWAGSQLYPPLGLTVDLGLGAAATGMAGLDGFQAGTEFAGGVFKAYNADDMGDINTSSRLMAAGFIRLIKAWLFAKDEPHKLPDGYKLEKATPTQFVVVDAANSELGISATLQEGRLRFGIDAITEAGERGTVRGRVLFNEMMEHFKQQNIKAIEGNWNAGTNLAKFNELTEAGVPAAEAAAKTWTGEQAARWQYTKVIVESLIGKRGKYAQVNVRFEKP